jgi:hypothetical protein
MTERQAERGHTPQQEVLLDGRMDLFSFPFRFVVGGGVTTRFLRFDAGSGRDELATDDFWEEIYIVSGRRNPKVTESLPSTSCEQAEESGNS